MRLGPEPSRGEAGQVVFALFCASPECGSGEIGDLDWSPVFTGTGGVNSRELGCLARTLWVSNLLGA